MRWRKETLREVLLVTALGAAVALGTPVAAAGQAPPRVPLDEFAWVLMALAVALVPLRLVRPVVTLIAITLVTGTYLVAGYPYGPVVLALAVTAYAVALTTKPPVAWSALGLSFTALVGAQTDLARPVEVLPAVFAVVLWLGLPALLAKIARLRRDAVDERLRQRALVEREHAERLAVEHRLAISREVHDVVAHSLSLISLQAGLAVHLFDRQPDEARAALTTIRQSSGEALADLRRVLTSLREPAPTAPDHLRLDRLGEVVDRVRRGGRSVSLEVIGRVRPMPGAVETCAYRVVQESLTNVLKHTDDASAAVRLTYGEDDMTVEVVDTGGGNPSPGGSGQGIAGIRDRVVALGGRLSAGPVPSGGFRVRAWLPVVGG
ncbi:sensor histidine kinase [Amycolatopsis sp. CA-230715]|uniref:sensor histidine kinase n=1 Tax=Amycolatopsis sp. CA-230715 TaxID=2745196 RepID=UPI001C027654|nr:histidine kinase [Amycolatopsis sp. CA-230715]